MASDTESVDNKRKRQNSIKGAEKVLTDTSNAVTPAAPASVSATPEPDTSAAQQHGSSPAKRPRTSEDGDDDVVHSPREENAGLEEKPGTPEKKETPTPKPAPATTSAFGSKFSSGLGFASALGSTPNKPPAFASYTGITSGFAKYASETTSSADGGDEGSALNTPKSPLAAANVSTATNGKDGEGDDGEQDGTNKKTFEDLLTAEGKETLASNVALSSVVPAMAHANVSPAPVIPIRTHEEDETCIYTTKAKLFELAGDAWKERGGGHFKINRRNDDHNRRRMVMRTDQTFRLILNVSLFSEMKASSERRFVRFTNIDPETKTPITFVLRLASEDLAAEVAASINKFVPKTSTVLPNVQDGDNSEREDDEADRSDHSGEDDSGEDEDSADDNQEDEDDQEDEDEESEEEEEEDDSGSEEDSDQQDEANEEGDKVKSSR